MPSAQKPPRRSLKNPTSACWWWRLRNLGEFGVDGGSSLLLVFDGTHGAIHDVIHSGS